MVTINRELLVVKLFYFLSFGGMGAVKPYIMIMAIQFGATPALIGVMYSTLPFYVMMAKLGCGSLADKLQQRKAVMLIAMTFVTFSLSSIYFIPPQVDFESASITTPNALLCGPDGLAMIDCSGATQHLLVTDTSTGITSSDKRILGRPNPVTCNFSCLLEPRSLQPFCPALSRMRQTGNDSPETAASCFPNGTTITDEGHWVEIAFFSTLNVDDIFAHQYACHGYRLVDFATSDEAGQESIPHCPNSTEDIPCNVSCSNGYLSINANVSVASVNNEGEEVSNLRLNTQLIMLWICLIIAGMSAGVVASVGDSAILDLLENKGHFGRQRLWGSLGLGGVSTVSGKLVDLYSAGKPGLRADFFPAYCLALVLGLLSLLITTLRFNVSKSFKPKNIFRSVGGLFLKPEVVTFAIAVFAVGIITGNIWTFLLVYLNELGANKFLIGLTLAVQCYIGEVPFFFVSNWFLKKLGHAHAMTLVLAVFGVRVALYSFITDPWMVLPIEISQGITFGLFFAALATYSSILAPPSTQATMQSIFQAVFDGLGMGTGALIGGFMYQTLGGKQTFFINGMVCGCLAIVYGLAQCYIQRRCNEKEVIHEANDKGDAGVEDDKLATEMTRMFPAPSENVNEIYDTA